MGSLRRPATDSLRRREDTAGESEASCRRVASSRWPGVLFAVRQRAAKAAKEAKNIGTSDRSWPLVPILPLGRGKSGKEGRKRGEKREKEGEEKAKKSHQREAVLVFHSNHRLDCVRARPAQGSKFIPWLLRTSVRGHQSSGLCASVGQKWPKVVPVSWRQSGRKLRVKLGLA